LPVLIPLEGINSSSGGIKRLLGGIKRGLGGINVQKFLFNPCRENKI
jgi:hypothetical protein